MGNTAGQHPPVHPATAMNIVGEDSKIDGWVGMDHDDLEDIVFEDCKMEREIQIGLVQAQNVLSLLLHLWKMREDSSKVIKNGLFLEIIKIQTIC